MRRFVFALAVLLAPLAMYASGCRQDSRQAGAFPKGPEVKNLARASAAFEDGSAPVIPAAASTDSMYAARKPGFSRVQAVQDRQQRLTGDMAVNPDLFAMAPAGRVGAPYSTQKPVLMPVKVMPVGERSEPLPEPTPIGGMQAPAPARSPRPEFWSAPLSWQAPAGPAAITPADISAMAPPAPQPGLQILPPAAPAPRGSDTIMMPKELFRPDTIPGVYLGPEEYLEPLSMRDQPQTMQPAGELLPPPASSIDFPSPATMERRLKTLEAAGSETQKALAPLPRLWEEEPAAPIAAAPALPEPVPPPPLELMPELPSLVLPLEEPVYPDGLEPVEPEVPELKEPAAPWALPLPPDEKLEKKEPEQPAKKQFSEREMYKMDFWKTEEKTAPRKVRLSPAQTKKSMQSIDAEAAPPPMLF